MNSYLVVYNICEIANANYEWYTKCIDNLLKLDYKKYHIAVSGCKTSDDTRKKLYERYKGKISFCFTENYLTTNVTFNLTVKKCVERFGSFDGYVYLNSGVNVTSNYNLLTEINNRINTNKYGVVTVQTDTDQTHVKDEDYIMPIGKNCNMYAFAFTDELREAYNGKLIPDIFNVYCVETVISLLLAAIKKQWVVIKDITLTHNKEEEDNVPANYLGTEKLYSSVDVNELLNDPKAKEVGIDDILTQKYIVHNPNFFTKAGYAKKTELKNYINDKLFLSSEQLDYNHILNFFIPVK